jgi:hypothetical protein
MKVESDVNILSEEDSIDVKSEEVHIPSGFSIRQSDPEVSIVFRCFLILIYVCTSTRAFMYVLVPGKPWRKKEMQKTEVKMVGLCGG